MQLINIGFGNIVSAERIISIVSPESAPIKRIVQEAKELDIETISKQEIESLLNISCNIWSKRTTLISPLFLLLLISL